MRSEDIKYVIIQAGGKGIRMGRYAENKPKCLVPVKGIPMIMNTIEKYKDCLLYTSPSPRDGLLSRMPSSA